MSFEIIPGKEYYRVVFDKELHKAGIIEYYQYLRDARALPRKMKILIDTSSCRFTVKTAEISQLNIAMKEAVREFDFLKEAIIVTQPYETVIATLFAEANREENYEFRVFSTEGAAGRWLTSS